MFYFFKPLTHFPTSLCKLSAVMKKCRVQKCFKKDDIFCKKNNSYVELMIHCLSKQAHFLLFRSLEFYLNYFTHFLLFFVSLEKFN